mmetsp:Transcript_7524/g.11881  ORF Transcript_7524/g.11881 Transcript_7524/m.11881 type:complete len:261 (+) Transcript_7524:193-975(+)
MLKLVRLFLSVLVAMLLGLGAEGAGTLWASTCGLQLGGQCGRLRGGGIPLREWLMIGSINKDANVSRSDMNQKLHESAELGSCEGIIRALELGAQVNSQGPGLWTALHLAARYGHWEAINVLVASGADMETKTKAHFTALHHAAMRGHTIAAVRLIESGADLMAETLEGDTPLDWAERNGHLNTLLALHKLHEARKPEELYSRTGTVAVIDHQGHESALINIRPAEVPLAKSRSVHTVAVSTYLLRIPCPFPADGGRRWR